MGYLRYVVNEGTNSIRTMSTEERISVKNLLNPTPRELSPKGDPPKKCPHVKRKQHCRICSPQNFCAHDRQKHLCKECGGKTVCEHGRQRSRCKDCGGSSICQHGYVKQNCKECVGKNVCWHGRYKYTCLDCKDEKEREKASGAGGAAP